jgi:hypothetical protein
MKKLVFVGPARRTVTQMFIAAALVGFGLSGCSADNTRATSKDSESTEDATEADAGVVKDASKPRPDARASTDDEDDDDGKKPTTTKPVVPDDGEDKCAGIRKEAPVAQGGVDIIFVIDTSASMASVTMQVQMNIEGFMRQFESSRADTHVTIITNRNLAAGTSLETDKTRYRFVMANVDSKQLYNVTLATYPMYQDFMRPGAATQFVMITDDEDIVPFARFQQQMTTNLGHDFTQHAIASESKDGIPCAVPGSEGNPLCIGPIPVVCTATAVGAQYYSLADATMGEKISICSSDFTTVFDRITSAVIAAVPLPCDYPLADATSADFDPALVQVVYSIDKVDREFPKATAKNQCGDKVGWFYDDEGKPSVISLCPAACEAVSQGGGLDIAFGCVPQVFI